MDGYSFLQPFLLAVSAEACPLCLWWQSLLGHGDGLGEVPRLVGIKAAQACQVVAQQLQRHDIDHRLHRLLHLGHLQSKNRL